ncbi:MAG: copper homeostasis membrane protein CopD [Sphingomicrobium sp.]
MFDEAVIALRFLQYGAAAILMGSPLFFLYALPRTGPAAAAGLRWPKPLFAVAAIILLLATAAGLLFQTAGMAGSLAEAVKLESISAVLGMNLGASALVRAPLALLALVVVLIARRGHRLWLAIAALGTAAMASFTWTGHGAATDGAGGWVHLIADVLHSWTAAIWIGALVGFALLLSSSSRDWERLKALHRALHRFSAVGMLLVAVLVATGLINSWFLVGLDHVAGLWTTDYGRLLLLKIVLFTGMLGLAAANRFRHTPALGANLGAEHAGGVSLAKLRRSIATEALLGFGVLALVAWFGTLAPPASI